MALRIEMPVPSSTLKEPATSPVAIQPLCLGMPQQYHAGKSNFLFADGHVKAMTPGQTWRTSDTVTTSASSTRTPTVPPPALPQWKQQTTTPVVAPTSRAVCGIRRTACIRNVGPLKVVATSLQAQSGKGKSLAAFSFRYKLGHLEKFAEQRINLEKFNIFLIYGDFGYTRKQPPLPHIYLHKEGIILIMRKASRPNVGFTLIELLVVCHYRHFSRDFVSCLRTGPRKSTADLLSLECQADWSWGDYVCTGL